MASSTGDRSLARFVRTQETITIGGKRERLRFIERYANAEKAIGRENQLKGSIEGTWGEYVIE
jgi:hypothetical protein